MNPRYNEATNDNGSKLINYIYTTHMLDMELENVSNSQNGVYSRPNIHEGGN